MYHGYSPQPPRRIDRVAADELLLARILRGSANAASTRSGLSPTLSGNGGCPSSCGRYPLADCRTGGRTGSCPSCPLEFRGQSASAATSSSAGSARTRCTTPRRPPPAADLDLLPRLAIDVGNAAGNAVLVDQHFSRDAFVRSSRFPVFSAARQECTASRRTIPCHSPRCSCRSSDRRGGC